MAWYDAIQTPVKLHEALAPHTYLQLGGKAECWVEPRSVEELIALLKLSQPVHVLGKGTKTLICGDVPGLTVQLSAAPFTSVTISGRRVVAGAGATLFDVLAMTTRTGLSGLESFVGFAGTIGGALRTNLNDRFAELNSFVRKVETLDQQGNVQQYDRADLYAEDHSWDVVDPIILSVELELEVDTPVAIEKRLRKTWLQRSATMPMLPTRAVQLFQNPRGQSAAGLIERAGLGQAKMGLAEIAEKNSNFAVVHPGMKAGELFELMNLIQTRVKEQCGVQLVRSLNVW